MADEDVAWEDSTSGTFMFEVIFAEIKSWLVVYDVLDISLFLDAFLHVIVDSFFFFLLSNYSSLQLDVYLICFRTI